MLHFRKMSSDRSLSDMRALCGHSTMPPWLKTLSTGVHEAGMANVCFHRWYQFVIWPYCESGSQQAMSHSHHPSHVSIWLKAWPLKLTIDLYLLFIF